MVEATGAIWRHIQQQGVLQAALRGTCSQESQQQASQQQQRRAAASGQGGAVSQRAQSIAVRLKGQCDGWKLVVTGAGGVGLGGRERAVTCGGEGALGGAKAERGFHMANSREQQGALLLCRSALPLTSHTTWPPRINISLQVTVWVPAWRLCSV